MAFRNQASRVFGYLKTKPKFFFKRNNQTNHEKWLNCRRLLHKPFSPFSKSSTNPFLKRNEIGKVFELSFLD